MLRRSIALLVFLTGLFFATSAFAANGYTIGNVNMRTGPGVYYPRIAVVPVGSPVTINRCTQGHRWCNIRWRGYRGWVSGHYLRFGDYRPRIYVPPPDIYFDFDFREPRWRDRHDRWHRRKPYPRWKKWRPPPRGKNRRPPPRWKKRRPPPGGKNWRPPNAGNDLGSRGHAENKIIRRDWNRDHDRWHQNNSVPMNRFIRRQRCPPNGGCD